MTNDKNLKLGLLGRSLPYTLSPQIHSLFMKKHGPFSYNLWEAESINDVDKDKLSQYDGLNVTVPYKQEVVQFLDELIYDAKYLKAVNTIYMSEGKLIGANTDTYGFKKLLQYNKINPEGKVCVILGSGGACQAVKLVLMQLHAERVIVASRKPERDNMCSYEELRNIKGYLIVNTTPVGTFPNIEDSPVSEEIIKNFDAVVDIVYNPSITKFLSYGIKHNKIVANGLYMLVSQAVKSEEYWQNIEYNKKVVDAIYSKIKTEYNIKNESNIYLTGMMSCGKSTVGEQLAKELDYEFIDLDKYIEHMTNKSIKELFEISEEFFREQESTALTEIALNKKKCVIATGGGIIKNHSNILKMRVSGLVIWLDRDIRLIAKYCDNSNRPLLQGKNQYLFTIFKERKAKYLYAKDIRVCNNRTSKECVSLIKYLIYKGAK